MKIICGLFLCLMFIGCSTSAPPVQKTFTAAERENIAGKIGERLAKSAIETSVSGTDKDVLILRSATVSNDQISTLLKDDLKDLKEDGFTEIQTTDSAGNIQHINLKVFNPQ